MSTTARLLLTLLALVMAAAIVGLLWTSSGGAETGEQELSPVERPLSPGGQDSVADLAAGELVRDVDRTSQQRETAPEGRADGALRVRGRVVDVQGEPVAHVEVSAAEFEDPEFVVESYEGFRGRTSTDAEGGFDLRVDRQGEFLVWATHHSGVSHVVSVVLNPRTPGAEIELQLVAPSTIEGVVLGEDLKPLNGVEVRAFVDVDLLGLQLPAGTTSVELYGLASTRTAADGSFRLHPVRDRGERLVVQAKRRVSARETVETATGREVRTRNRTWIASQAGVAPGFRGLSLIVRPPDARAGTLLLKLQAENQGSLSTIQRGTLRRIGPNGGAYDEQFLLPLLEPEGVFRIDSLQPGARYDFKLNWKGATEPTTVGPFVAESGEQTLEVAVPGCHTASIQVMGGDRESLGPLVVQVIQLQENGARRSAASAALLPEEVEKSLCLREGTYEVRITKQRSASGGAGAILASTTLEMPAVEVSVTLELP